MTNRTTQKDLEGLVHRLNGITDNQDTPYTKNTDGKFIANIGNYHLDYAYGGVKLVQMMGGGGSIRTITIGYESKSICYMQISSYIKGIEDCILASNSHDKLIKKIVA